MTINWRYVLFILVVVPLLLFTAESITTTPFLITSIIASCFIALVTFQKPVNGLTIIVFSMLLSPQIVAASLPGRDVTLRVDDWLIVMMSLAWLAYTAKDKDWKGFLKTPIDSNLALITVIYVISTALGIIEGHLNPVKSSFYMLKYIEYFVLYYVAANIISDVSSLKRFLVSGAVTAIIVTIFAFTLIGKVPRVYAPFETGGGEPASLAGYFLIVYAVCIGFFLTSENPRARLFSGALMLFMFTPFIKTLSRASYMAFVPMVLSFLVFSKKRKAFFAFILMAGVFTFPFLFRGLYQDLTARVSSTFIGTSSMDRGEVLAEKKIRDPSATDRLDSYQWVLKNRLMTNLKTITIGNGVTGTGFIDGQIFTFLGEIGLLGTLAFYLMMLKIILVSYRTYLTIEDDTAKSLSLGLIGALVALLFQSTTTNTFIIVRINEPIWFLIALVMILPNLYAGKAAAGVPPAAGHPALNA